jgi:hypothetical protein
LVDFEHATAEPNPFLPDNARRRTLRAPDGKLYIGKNDYCHKSPGNLNTAWLANEIVAAEYANAAGLRVPGLRLLRADGRDYLGSEFLRDRVPLRRGEVRKLFRDDNQTQLTRALLLDLALLNSDRTAGNTLRDAAGRLWFFDFDKALWGDGREASDQPPGDLHRLDLGILDQKFEAYLGDFLGYRDANALAFTAERCRSVVEEFDRLPLDAGGLERAKGQVPESWRDDNLFRRLAVFLVEWWSRLRDFIHGSGACSSLRTLLSKRGRFDSATAEVGLSRMPS